MAGRREEGRLRRMEGVKGKAEMRLCGSGVRDRRAGRDGVEASEGTTERTLEGAVEEAVEGAVQGAEEGRGGGGGDDKVDEETSEIV